MPRLRSRAVALLAGLLGFATTAVAHSVEGIAPTGKQAHCHLVVEGRLR